MTKEIWDNKRKKAETVLFRIHWLLFAITLAYCFYTKFTDLIIIGLSAALLIINIYTNTRKGEDTNENSILYAETMAHSFLCGFLIVNIINIFKGTFLTNYIWIIFVLVALIFTIIVYIEKQLYEKTDNKNSINADHLIFTTIEIALFNLIPAYLITYFLEDSIKSQTGYFFFGIILIFLSLFLFFVVKNIFFKKESIPNKNQ